MLTPSRNNFARAGYMRRNTNCHLGYSCEGRNSEYHSGVAGKASASRLLAAAALRPMLVVILACLARRSTAEPRCSTSSGGAQPQ